MATGTNSSSNLNLRSTKKNAEQNGTANSDKYLEDSLKVKFNNIKTLISRQKDELDSAFNSAIESCRNELSDQICETNSRIDTVQSDLNLANTTILELKQKITALESREKDHLALTQSNLFQSCRNEQRLRGWSIKVINFQHMESDDPPTIDSIWNELIRPSLQEAVKSGKLKWLPEHREAVIEHGHEHAGSRGDGPRTFFIRFHSRSQMFSFFNNMKPFIKSLEDRNASFMDLKNKPPANKVAQFFPDRKIKVVSSVTSMHTDLWSYLYTYEEVEHVKMLGNFLGVKIRGSTVYQKVVNPFGISLAQMLEPMATVTSILSRISRPVPPLVTHSLKKKQIYAKSRDTVAPPSTPSLAPSVTVAPGSAAAAHVDTGTVSAPTGLVAGDRGAAAVASAIVSASLVAAAGAHDAPAMTSGTAAATLGVPTVAPTLDVNIVKPLLVPADANGTPAPVVTP